MKPFPAPGALPAVGEAPITASVARDRETAARASDCEPLLERYIADLKGGRNLSAYTLRNYAIDLRHYFTWLDDNNLALTSIVRSRFRAYIAGMQEAGVAQASVSRRVSTVKSFYRWLRLVGVMHDDPLVLVHGPKQAKRLPHVLTLDDIAALIGAADAATPAGLRDRALLELLYATGIRISEAHGLDLGDIDLDRRAIRVRGKGNKERITVMGEPARIALEAYVTHGRPGLLTRRKLSTGDPSSSPAFINRFGTRLTQRAIQILVRKYALKAGLDERVHPHLLRHSFATHLLDNGAELRVVQELMGHTNPNTTQIYLHVTEARQRTVMESSRDELAAVEIARRSLRPARRRQT